LISFKIEINAEKKGEDRDKESDAFAMGVITSIMNTVDKDIQITYDCPSDNESKMVPVLDLAMYMSENRIRFTFYSKPMATSYFIPACFTHTERTKRSTLTQKGIRRLLNGSPELPAEERARVLEEYE
jgi:hypothetical protein